MCKGLYPNATIFLKSSKPIVVFHSRAKKYVEMVHSNFFKVDFVVYNALVNMNFKCGLLKKLQKDFEEIAIWAMQCP